MDSVLSSLLLMIHGSVKVGCRGNIPINSELTSNFQLKFPPNRRPGIFQKKAKYFSKFNNNIILTSALFEPTHIKIQWKVSSRCWKYSLNQLNRSHETKVTIYTVRDRRGSLFWYLGWDDKDGGVVCVWVCLVVSGVTTEDHTTPASSSQ